MSLAEISSVGPPDRRSRSRSRLGNGGSAGGAAVFFSFGFLWFSLVFFWFSSGFLLFSLGFLLFSLGFLLFSSGFLTVLNRRKLKKTKENYKKTIRKLKKTKENYKKRHPRKPRWYVGCARA